MKVKISTTNSKLGLIPSVNLPPISTCRAGCPCAKDCYATKGNFRFSNVQKSLKDNLSIFLSSNEKYFEDIKNYIDNGMMLFKYFRWHASGDIVNNDYLENMVKTAKEIPQTSFLAFTKKYELLNEWISKNGELPQNLHIVFSAWGNDTIFDNPYNFPVAHVRFKDKEKNVFIPETAIECSGNCTTCLQCWNIKNGQAVVFDKH